MGVNFLIRVVISPAHQKTARQRPHVHAIRVHYLLVPQMPPSLPCTIHWTTSRHLDGQVSTRPTNRCTRCTACITSQTHSTPATVTMSPAPAADAPSGSLVTPLVTNKSATLCGPLCSPPPSLPRVLRDPPASTTPDTIFPVASRPRYLSLGIKGVGIAGRVGSRGSRGSSARGREERERV